MALRAVLPLLKARVVERGEAHFILGFWPEYGSPTRITVRPQQPMSTYDIREGDLLTLYTEVLFAERKPA